MPLEQVAHGDAHFLLHHNGVVDVSRDAEELGPLVAVAAQACEPRSPASEYFGGHCDGLNVGYCGGASEEADVGREWRLETGLAHAAFQALDERRLLSADVGSRSAMKVQVVVVAASTRVFAE